MVDMWTSGTLRCTTEVRSSAVQCPSASKSAWSNWRRAEVTRPPRALRSESTPSTLSDVFGAVAVVTKSHLTTT